VFRFRDYNFVALPEPNYTWTIFASRFVKTNWHCVNGQRWNEEHIDRTCGTLVVSPKDKFDFAGEKIV
jgi:hypothetical protein